MKKIAMPLAPTAHDHPLVKAKATKVKAIKSRPKKKRGK